MPEITTNRLLLRPFREDDAAALYAYSTDPEVGPNAGWKPHESLEESAEILRTVFLGQEAVFAVVRREDGVLMGSAGFIPDPARENPRARMLGYALGRAYWGQGYMTECVRAILAHGFGTMALDLVSVNCYPHNARSRNVIEKCGFRYEGTLRQAEELFDGTVHDHVMFSLTREEYCEHHSQIR